MDWPIVEEPIAHLFDYGRLPIAFRVDRVLEVVPVDGGLGGLALEERPVDPPYVKDYDAIPGNAPASWIWEFEFTSAGVLSALDRGRRVGGAIVAAGSPAMDLLEGRDDLAILLDIRVEPDFRGRGVGRSLFRAAEGWAQAHGFRQMKVETQNINVAACRFYARQGCVLGAIRRHAYRDLPGEVQLLWYKDLSPSSGRTSEGLRMEG